ncbi:MAG: hypothetical protein KC609_11620 [Myxococcales bacterium]|nr:hypothetical protein [Myxococcales bacterium]
MNNLTRDALDRALSFLSNQGRPLERALTAWTLGHAGSEAVLTALDVFQQPDGGFGAALEPDFQLPGASVLATTVGLQHLSAIGAAATDRRVIAALGYLARTYDPELASWPLVPKNADDAPHAPWWSVGDDFAEKWRYFQGNPKPEVAGYLLTWPSLAPPTLSSVAEQAIAWLESWTDEVEMHDLVCFVRLLETPALAEGLRARLRERLTPAVEAAVATSPEQWASYGLQPLEVAASPSATFASSLADALEANLDWLLTQQGDDGAWAPSWSWFGLYDESWPTAERAWKSILTAKALGRLSAFGRLPG